MKLERLCSRETVAAMVMAVLLMPVGLGAKGKYQDCVDFCPLPQAVQAQLDEVVGHVMRLTPRRLGKGDVTYHIDRSTGLKLRAAKFGGSGNWNCLTTGDQRDCFNDYRQPKTDTLEVVDSLGSGEVPECAFVREKDRWGPYVCSDFVARVPEELLSRVWRLMEKADLSRFQKKKTP